ncbi:MULTISPECIES: DUF808 family protein [Actinomyces]|uniref:DUF808 family protein n=1 Tax=Actinomyces respiraculi TaxID=2744574 RepID=A0A7T0LIL6_9ACTO|nr:MULTISPECIES: DUF808 family protein [Actinomyces]QPL04439.1 DUF808 family protein [Actinomyces respiraculi]
MSGFFALLDDIATLAKLTLATVDDTAAMAVKTSAKVSAAAVDDVAATPQYVTGITPDREIPIIRRIALGSLRNKLLIILPLALALSWIAPTLLPVALVIGGTYLCFEGGQKVLETIAHRLGHAHHGAESSGPVDEDTIVRRATTTDVILSTEIMLLALAEVQGESSGRRVVVLILIALLITFAVYGLVAALIKLDDLGLRLASGARTEHSRRAGRAVVRLAPGLFSAIGVLGTVAMLWVGGQILAHNLAALGVAGPHHLMEHVGQLVHVGVVSWVLTTAAACVFGALVGIVLALLVTAVTRLAR